MSTYKEIFGKPIKVLPGDPAPTPVTYTVTVANPGSGNVYYIDGVQTPTLELYEGNTYNFDYSAATGHPFRFATAADAAGSTEYTTGVSVDSNITTIVVASGAPTLFYYCTNHSGMGGRALTPASPSEYEGQIWYNEAEGKFKSVLSTGAWVSSSALNTARIQLSGAISSPNDASLAFGGYTGTASNSTEEYNGSGWAVGGNLGSARYQGAGAGTQTAALYFGGRPPGSGATTTEEYNGSSWTGGGALPVAKMGLAGCGIQTAALAFGGSPPTRNTTEEYSSSSWTAGGTLSVAFEDAAGAGTVDAGLKFGGRGTPTQTTEKYNGSSWTTSGLMNTGRGYLGGAGIQTSALAYGGYMPPGYITATEQYDGSVWSTLSATMGTGIRQFAGTGATSSGALAFGGESAGTATLGTTEEYNKTINTLSAAAWSSGGNYPTGVQGMGAAGTQTATVTAGGAGPTNLACEYNGSSWTTITNYPISVRDVTGTGVQTAGFMISGYQSSPPPTGNREKTNYWNGSSWSAGGDLNNSTNRQLGGSAGVLAAALFWGGDGGTPITAFESYNGSAWTALTAAPFGGNSSGCGTSTAALATPGPSVNTYEWGGSSWTAGGNMSQQHEYGNVTGTQTDALQYGGGTPGSPAAYTNSVEGYDGTSWSTRPGMAQIRAIHGHGSQGTSTKALATAGYYPGSSPAALNATEEFNGVTETLGYKTLTSS